jgi:gamma-glutamyltranspeptidase/glutathione hydrolase
MVDQESAARPRGRAAGLAAARDSFYRGDIAQAIVKHQKENGGFLSADDLANYRSGFDAPVTTTFGDIQLYACGPWCQGPSLLQALKRRAMIRPDRAWPEVPPAGVPRKLLRERARAGVPLVPEKAFSAPEIDTSHVSVIDRHGNVFAATPSDGSYNAPVIPELGIIPSPRGSQNWGDPDHPSGVAPGKRPRLTPSPAIAMTPGKMKMPFGTPGGDVQTQAMLQAFLNIHVFGIEPQDAVEAPRGASYSYPGSFEPHAYHPGLLNLESRIDRATGDALGRLGHKIEWWPDWTWLAGAVCTVVADLESGVLKGGADPRRPSYALGL